MKNQINSKLQTQHKLLFLFLIFTSMATAQNWTQLGRGNGGQVRALYLHDQNPNGGGPFNLYIGSDVAGVWKSANIASASALQLETNYQYNYISNSDIMRFTNKFYRPQRTSYKSDFLFVANYQGIHRIDLNSPDGNMLQVLDFPDSWVSDMYFCDIDGTNHAMYFTTGNTRVNDGIASNSKVNNVFDFYWGTLNQAENFINPQTLRGIKLEGMTANGDVYCLKVIDNNTPQISDDNYLIGSETGLWIFTNTDAVAAELLPNKTLVKLNHLSPNPDGTSNPYQVTSIIDAPTPGHYLVTISGGGIYEWNGSTWTSLGDDITLSEQSNTNTITYTGWNNVPGDAKLLNQILPVVVTNVLQGYILVNENFEMQNAPYYCGVYYCNKLNTTAWNWQSLSVTNAGNNWGWNSTLPAGNINSALLTPGNDLLIGKNGNLHITQNGDITQIANTDWEQIYTHKMNTSCNGTWQNKGFVNTVNAGLYLDGTILYGGEFDRGLMKSDVNYNFTWINKVGVNPCEHLLFNGSFSGCQNILPPAIVDCKYIAANNNTLYAAVAEGTSVNKGRGYIMKKPNGVTEWTQLGSTFCGDPVKIFFDAANNPYCIVNSTNPTQQSIYVLNGSIWQLCSFFNTTTITNDGIVDALIATEGATEYIYFIKNTSGKGVYKVEKTTTLGTFSNSTAILPILTTRVGKQLSIMPFGSSFKVLIALKNNPNNPAANNFYESNSGLTSVTAINNCATTNVPSVIFSSPGVDETQSGVTAIEVNNNVHAIYAATLIEDPVTHKTHSHLYRTTYDNGTGAIGPCWSEITNNLPNKAINCIYPQTILGTENIFTCIRGMGEWRNEICMAIHCTVTNPTTACISNGIATAVVDIGTAPYTYTWSNNQTNATATGLAAGTYTVTVTGSAGACTATASFTIAGLGAICTVTNSCTSGNGMATVATTGGTAPYTYSWSSSPPQSTNPATGLVAGTYTVTVTDANACTTTASCTVTPSTGIASITLANEGITCTGNDDGYTSVSTVNGGVSPYMYLWSNGVTSALNNNVPTGTYTVTVTDAAGCTRTATTSVTQTAPNFASNIPPGNYFLNANVIISTPITVDHANIGIAPGVSITVNPGVVLNIVNYSKLNACGDMWQGIINNGGTVNITNSTIEDALTALDVKLNGQFDLLNSTFNRNWISLQINGGDYINSLTGRIRGCTFDCSTLITKAPHLNQISSRHINANFVTKLKIGDESLASYKNNFKRASLGVSFNGDVLKMVNNAFASNYSLLLGNNTNQAVNVSSQNPTSNDFVIGGTGLSSNSFQNYYQAVTIQGGNESKILSNFFLECNLAAALYNGYYNNAYNGSNENIKLNSFTNCRNGILCYENQGTPKITENDFNIGATYNNARYSREAIRVEIKWVVASAHVQNNHINNTMVGVHFRNLSNANANSNTYNTDIPNADIPAMARPHYGIWIENCAAADIQHNTIIRNDMNANINHISGMPQQDLMRGMGVDLSTRCQIKNNTTQNMGTDINTVGDCIFTEFRCNNMISSYRGVNMILSTLVSNGSHYGSPTDATENTWTGNYLTAANIRIDGTYNGLPINWYHTGTAQQSNPASPYNAIPVIPKGNATGQACPQIANDDGDAEVTELRNAALNQATYIDYVNENRYTDDANAYELLDADSNLQDSVNQYSYLVQWRNAMQQGNIGKFEDARDYIAAKNKQAAQIKVSAISTNNQINTNLKVLAQIYLDYVIDNEQLELDSATRILVENIAYQKVIEGGEAVYIARAMLHLDIEDYYLVGLRKANFIDLSSNEQFIPIFKVIPNPTSDFIEVNTNFEFSKLEITDIYGRLLFIEKINHRTKTQKIVLQNFANGPYLLKIHATNGNVSVAKIIISK
ncbi:MAG: T9SS type A sorting domain-containing protein [Bacteroidetes bacterium]|nr:T9SS type A sorting domain-containing protein [Bacteroidota bacterium]